MAYTFQLRWRIRLPDILPLFAPFSQRDHTFSVAIVTEGFWPMRWRDNFMQKDKKLIFCFSMGPAQPGYLGALRTVINRVGKVVGLSQEKQANCFLGLRHALRHLYRYLHSSNDARLLDFAQLLQFDPRLNSNVSTC